jgi:hypothetical protein
VIRERERRGGDDRERKRNRERQRREKFEKKGRRRGRKESRRKKFSLAFLASTLAFFRSLFKEGTETLRGAVWA